MRLVVSAWFDLYKCSNGVKKLKGTGTASVCKKRLGIIRAAVRKLSQCFCRGSKQANARINL